MSTAAAHAHTRSHEFWKGSLRILGFGVPSMPNPSSGALRSTLPGPRERSGILSAHLALMSACAFFNGSPCKRKDTGTGGLGPDIQGLGRGLAGGGRWPPVSNFHGLDVANNWIPVGVGLPQPNPGRASEDPARAHRYRFLSFGNEIGLMWKSTGSDQTDT